MNTTSLAPKICSRLLLSSAALPMFLASSAFAQTPAAARRGRDGCRHRLADRAPGLQHGHADRQRHRRHPEESGQIALEAGLKDLPQFSTSTGGAGPFIGGSGQANVSLRGLGPQRNLVLLDGRRLLPSNSDGTVDINQLPPASSAMSKSSPAAPRPSMVRTRCRAW